MYWLHAFAVLLTLLLFLLRKNLAVPVGDKKRKESFSSRLGVCSDLLRGKMQHCGLPKCKRDPDILLDNESIGHHPHDNWRYCN